MVLFPGRSVRVKSNVDFKGMDGKRIGLVDAGLDSGKEDRTETHRDT